MKEGAEELRPEDSTKTRRAQVEQKEPAVNLNVYGRRPEDFITFGNGHLAV